MSHYKPYPAYRDSEVEWIGEVPEHWTIQPVKQVFSTRLGKMISPKPSSEDDLLVPYHRAQTVQWEKIEHEQVEKMWASGKEIASFGVRKGDLLICEGGDVCRAAICDIEPVEPTIIQNSIHRVRSKGFIKVEWLLHLMQLVRSSEWIDVLCNKNTTGNFTSEKLDNLRIPVPSGQEHGEILEHLNCETTRIDALIAKKTRFIELLKEKRQALITHAVTKGLNPKVKMKNSGVEWIGEVPEHWTTYRMATLFKEAVRVGRQELPILSISIHNGITDEEIDPEERDRQVYQIEDRTKYKRVVPDDLAYNMMRAWQGAFGAVKVEGLVSPAYVVAEPIRDFRTSYIELLLRTPMAVEEMRRFSRGIADFRMRLYWEYFRDLVVCLPPLFEQDSILERISSESTRIDLLFQKTQHSIDLLKERRSAFITAAVTGKIDLRNKNVTKEQS